MWTARSYQLGWAGLIVGSLTLIAAGFAAKYARDAAIHTERSADTAWTLGKPQAEADIALRIVSVNVGNDDGRVTWANPGTSAGRSAELHGTIDLRLGDEVLHQGDLTLRSPITLEPAPQSEGDVGFHHGISPDAKAQIVTALNAILGVQRANEMNPQDLIPEPPAPVLRVKFSLKYETAFGDAVIKEYVFSGSPQGHFNHAENRFSTSYATLTDITVKVERLDAKT